MKAFRNWLRCFVIVYESPLTYEGRMNVAPSSYKTNAWKWVFSLVFSYYTISSYLLTAARWLISHKSHPFKKSLEIFFSKFVLSWFVQTKLHKLFFVRFHFRENWFVAIWLWWKSKYHGDCSRNLKYYISCLLFW